MLIPAIASLIEKLHSMLLTGDFNRTLFFLWNITKTSTFVRIIKDAKTIFAAWETLLVVMFLSRETGTAVLGVDIFGIGV